MLIKPTTAQGAAFVALLAGGVGAAPPTTVSAATYAGANSADVYPPASSKLTLRSVPIAREKKQG